MKPSGRPSELNGFLDKGSDLKGELHFETHFRVHGNNARLGARHG